MVVVHFIPSARFMDGIDWEFDFDKKDY